MALLTLRSLRIGSDNFGHGHRSKNDNNGNTIAIIVIVIHHQYIPTSFCCQPAMPRAFPSVNKKSQYVLGGKSLYKHCLLRPAWIVPVPIPPSPEPLTHKLRCASRADKARWCRPADWQFANGCIPSPTVWLLFRLDVLRSGPNHTIGYPKKKHYLYY